MSVLSPLPDKGWGVLRAPKEIVLVLCAVGLIKVQMTAHEDVFQARLTGAGRTYRNNNDQGGTNGEDVGRDDR